MPKLMHAVGQTTRMKAREALAFLHKLEKSLSLTKAREELPKATFGGGLALPKTNHRQQSAHYDHLRPVAEIEYL